MACPEPSRTTTPATTLAPGGPEAALAPRGGRELGDVDEADPGDGLDNQLGDAVAAADGERLGRGRVEQHQTDLTAVAGVDRAGGVDHGDAVAGGQAGAGMDEGGVAVGHGHGQPGADRGPPAPREDHVLGGAQVGPGVAGMGVGGQGQVQVRVQPADRQLGNVHGGTFRRNGQGPGPRFPSRPGAQLIPGEPALDPPGRITAMSFYPCGPARGKLEGYKEVRRLAGAQAGDELFDLAPEEFVAARDELARRLKRGGEAEAAASVKALRRPPLPPWAV